MKSYTTKGGEPRQSAGNFVCTKVSCSQEQSSAPENGIGLDRSVVQLVVIGSKAGCSQKYKGYCLAGTSARGPRFKGTIERGRERAARKHRTCAAAQNDTHEKTELTTNNDYYCSTGRVRKKQRRTYSKGRGAHGAAAPPPAESAGEGKQGGGVHFTVGAKALTGAIGRRVAARLATRHKSCALGRNQARRPLGAASRSRRCREMAKPVPIKQGASET